jgi:hypothetical protein
MTHPVESAEVPTTAAVLVDIIRSAARIVAVAEGAGLAALAELVRLRRAELCHPAHGADDGVESRHDPLDVDECDAFTADELAAALHMSSRAASARVALADDLVSSASATLAALREGVIDLARARRIVEVVRSVHEVDPAAAQEVEALALAVAPDRTPPEVAATARRAVHRLAPDAVAAARAQARARRRAGVEPAADPLGPDSGCATFWITGDEARVEAIWRALSRHAHARVEDARSGGEGLTLDQARSDVALDALQNALADEELSPAAPVPVAVSVILPLASLVGQSDEPADLVGQGPIPAGAARDLLLGGDGRLRADVSLERWLTDARGAVALVPAGTYRPPTRMADMVRARDRHCRFPGCRRRADLCDLDHVVPWPRGATAPANLMALCRHHHRAKHRAGWHVISEPDGTVTWTAPDGHTTRITRSATWP